MREMLYETARRLIAFDTVSSRSNAPAAEFLAEHFSNFGFKVVCQRVEISGVPQVNVVASTGPLVPDGLIISGHIDTVPFEGQPGWTRKPLKMEVDDDRIYGRGASDMKGFLAQCVVAASRIERESLRKPLVFLFTADEEVGYAGAEKVAPELAGLLDDVPAPRLAWIGEPTSYRVCHAHKSIVTFEITVAGRGGHSGTPDQGVNAIAVMGKVLDVIGRLQHERASNPDPRFVETFPEAPCDVMNLGTIEGGLAANMIAERCVIKVSYRSLPGSDPLALYRELERRVAEIDTHDYALGKFRAEIRLRPPMAFPSLNSPRGTALEKALFEATGATASRGAPFGTDGGWFSHVGIDSLICGPGDLEQAHQPNESLGRDAFERGAGIILDVVRRMCC
jgi:acetylornithine deacetylase